MHIITGMGRLPPAHTECPIFPVLSYDCKQAIKKNMEFCRNGICSLLRPLARSHPSWWGRARGLCHDSCPGTCVKTLSPTEQHSTLHVLLGAGTAIFGTHVACLRCLFLQGMAVSFIPPCWRLNADLSPSKT